MQLKYKNIYIINKKEKKENDIDSETRTKITKELKLQMMNSFGYYPKNKPKPKI